MKRVVIVSDFHCGSRSGLTPPEWWSPDSTTDGRNQRLYWKFYSEEIARLAPIDLLVINGDATDGTGHRAGGTDQATTDREVQMEMAVVAVKIANPKRIVMTFGTPYHVGEGEDFESILAKLLRAEIGVKVRIGSHETVNVNGLVFDFKHKIGASGIPHGRHTAVARERLWGILWAEEGQRAKAHVTIRSHVHYFGFCGGKNWLGMTTPCLQGLGSKYGSRQCSGTIDFGFVHFDVVSRWEYSWAEHVLPLSEVAEEPVIV